MTGWVVMPEVAPERNKGGRPLKDPSGGKRPTVTFRCRSALQSKVQAAASDADRSVSEEIERRLERSFEGLYAADDTTRTLIENIAQIITMIESGSGKKWWEDELTAGMCGVVLRELFQQLMPEPEKPKNNLLELVETDMSRLEREAKEALWQTTVRTNAMDRAIAILKSGTSDAANAEAVDKLSQPQKTSGTR